MRFALTLVAILMSLACSAAMGVYMGYVPKEAAFMSLTNAVFITALYATHIWHCDEQVIHVTWSHTT